MNDQQAFDDMMTGIAAGIDQGRHCDLFTGADWPEPPNLNAFLSAISAMQGTGMDMTMFKRAIEYADSVDLPVELLALVFAKIEQTGRTQGLTPARLLAFGVDTVADVPAKWRARLYVLCCLQFPDLHAFAVAAQIASPSEVDFKYTFFEGPEQ